MLFKRLENMKSVSVGRKFIIDSFGVFSVHYIDDRETQYHIRYHRNSSSPLYFGVSCIYINPLTKTYTLIESPHRAIEYNYTMMQI